MSFDILKEVFANVWAYQGVKFIVSHILINVVLAVAGAAREGEFTFAKLGEFLYRKVLPYVFIYYGSLLFGDGTGLTFVAPSVWAIIEATLAANTLESLSKLGVPLPPALSGAVATPGKGTTIIVADEAAAKEVREAASIKE